MTQNKSSWDITSKISWGVMTSHDQSWLDMTDHDFLFTKYNFGHDWLWLVMSSYD